MMGNVSSTNKLQALTCVREEWRESRLPGSIIHPLCVVRLTVVEQVRKRIFQPYVIHILKERAEASLDGQVHREGLEIPAQR
jgi:hypothetical protein